MNLQCLHCEKSNIPLFEEWGRWRIFCGEQCQKDYQLIQSSKLLELYNFRKLSRLDFWTFLFNLYKNTLDDIVSDFSDIEGLFYKEYIDNQNNNMINCLDFIINKDQGIELVNSRMHMSIREFTKILFDTVCRLGKLNFAFAMVKVSKKEQQDVFITRDAFLTAIVYQRSDFLDNFIEKTNINKLDQDCYNWASFFGDEKTINVVKKHYKTFKSFKIYPEILNDDPITTAVVNTDNDNLVKILLRKYEPNADSIIQASMAGREKVVRLLLQDKRVDPTVNNNDALRVASRNGHLEVVKLLLQDKRVDPSANNNGAIGFASEYGHLEVVKLLLQDKKVYPSAVDNYAIRWASLNGHLEVVKFLLLDKRVDPSDRNNFAIREASKNGHLEVVKILLQDERVDPSDDNNYAIRYASRNGHQQVLKLLLSDKRINLDELREIDDENIKQLVKQIRITKSRGEEQEGAEPAFKRFGNKIKLFY